MDEIETEFPKLQPIRTDGKFEERAPFVAPKMPDDKTGFIRFGGCTVGCAACCQDIWLEVVVSPGLAENQELLVDWARWLKMHDVTLIKRPNAWYAVIGNVCENLADDGSCGVHGTDEYPSICKTFPVHPTQVEGLKHVCTYKFAPVPLEFVDDIAAKE